MIVRFKKINPEAVLPLKTEDNAGLDLTAISIDETTDYIEYDTGIAVEIPKGYVGLMFPRSSNSKKDLLLCNGVGVVDSCYRGSLRFRYKNVGHSLPAITENVYKVGDRVGQLIIMPYPDIEIEEATELSSTVRGEAGFGSTGS